MEHINEEQSPWKYTTYLIGAMTCTAEKDGGIGKREEVEKELTDRNILAINPATLEKAKTGITAQDAIEKIRGWVSGGKRELLQETGRKIWKGYDGVNEDGNIIHVGGDLDYVKISDFVTFILHKLDRPCVIGSSRILMDDLSSKALVDIQCGDKVKGFVRKNGKTLLTTATVTGKYARGIKDVIKVTNDRGNSLTCTPDHRILTRHPNTGSTFAPAGKVDNVFSVHVQDVNKQYIKGWLVGYLQHDGNFWASKTAHRVSCRSDKRAEIVTVFNILKKFGLSPKFRHVYINDGMYYEAATYSIRDYTILRNWKDNSTETISYMRGWLAGAIDADGYYEAESLRYTQSEVHEKNITQFKQYCTRLCIKYSEQIRNPRSAIIRGRTIGGGREHTICLSKINAFQLVSMLDYKKNKLCISIDRLNSKILTKINCPPQKVYDISTTTGNFVAEGFITHNCGTFFEVGVAIDQNIPVYLITDIPKRDLPQSLILGIEAVNGEFFENLSQYLKFIDEAYK